MELHLTATECHLPHGILLPDTSEHTLTLTPVDRLIIDLPPLETGVDLGDWLHTDMVTHPSTNPVVHGWESNSQLIDYKSNALTTKPPRQAM